MSYTKKHKKDRHDLTEFFVQANPKLKDDDTRPSHYRQSLKFVQGPPPDIPPWDGGTVRAIVYPNTTSPFAEVKEDIRRGGKATDEYNATVPGGLFWMSALCLYRLQYQGDKDDKDLGDLTKWAIYPKFSDQAVIEGDTVGVDENAAVSSNFADHPNHVSSLFFISNQKPTERGRILEKTIPMSLAPHVDKHKLGNPTYPVYGGGGVVMPKTVRRMVPDKMMLEPFHVSDNPQFYPSLANGDEYPPRKADGTYDYEATLKGMFASRFGLDIRGQKREHLDGWKDDKEAQEEWVRSGGAKWAKSAAVPMVTKAVHYLGYRDSDGNVPWIDDNAPKTPHDSGPSDGYGKDGVVQDDEGGDTQMHGEETDKRAKRAMWSATHDLSCLPQYHVSNWVRGPFLSATREDHTARQMGQQIGHITLANSPWWSLPNDQWKAVFEHYQMDFMPFVSPTGRTRPLNYRFWDGPETTGLYSDTNPTFECKTLDGKYNEKAITDYVHTIPDIQFYRDRLMLYITDEAQLAQWHYHENKHESETMQSFIERSPGVALAQNYGIMEGSATCCDLEYKGEDAGIFKAEALPMGQRRRMYQQSQMYANSQAWRSWRTTFVADPGATPPSHLHSVPPNITKSINPVSYLNDDTPVALDDWWGLIHKEEHLYDILPQCIRKYKGLDITTETRMRHLFKDTATAHVMNSLEKYRDAVKDEAGMAMLENVYYDARLPDYYSDIYNSVALMVGPGSKEMWQDFGNKVDEKMSAVFDDLVAKYDLGDAMQAFTKTIANVKEKGNPWTLAASTLGLEDKTLSEWVLSNVRNPFTVYNVPRKMVSVDVFSQEGTVDYTRQTLGPFGDKMSVRDALGEADRIRDQLAREDAEVVTRPLASEDPYGATMQRLEWQRAVMMQSPPMPKEKGYLPTEHEYQRREEVESQKIVERIKAELQEKGYMTSPSRYDRFLRMCRAYAKRADVKPLKPLTKKELDWFSKGKRYTELKAPRGNFDYDYKYNAYNYAPDGSGSINPAESLLNKDEWDRQMNKVSTEINQARAMAVAKEKRKFPGLNKKPDEALFDDYRASRVAEFSGSREAERLTRENTASYNFMRVPEVPGYIKQSRNYDEFKFRNFQPNAVTRLAPTPATMNQVKEIDESEMEEMLKLRQGIFDNSPNLQRVLLSKKVTIAKLEGELDDIMKYISDASESNREALTGETPDVQATLNEYYMNEIGVYNDKMAKVSEKLSDAKQDMDSLLATMNKASLLKTHFGGSKAQGLERQIKKQIQKMSETHYKPWHESFEKNDEVKLREADELKRLEREYTRWSPPGQKIEKELKQENVEKLRNFQRSSQDVKILESKVRVAEEQIEAGYMEPRGGIKAIQEKLNKALAERKADRLSVAEVGARVEEETGVKAVADTSVMFGDGHLTALVCLVKDIATMNAGDLALLNGAMGFVGSIEAMKGFLGFAVLTLVMYFIDEAIQHAYATDEEQWSHRQARADAAQYKTMQRYYSKGVSLHIETLPQSMKSYMEALGGKGASTLPYNVVLRAIMENRLCLSQVASAYMIEFASAATGMNLKLAETIRMMRLVDYFIRDSQLTPPIKGGREWKGVKRPFPPREAEPLSFVCDAMTPLPVYETLGVTVDASTLARWYGPDPSERGTEKWSVERGVPHVSVLLHEAGKRIPYTKETLMRDIEQQKIPTPVFVGFNKSPTGFVSSEDMTWAWPTLLHRHGGPIATVEEVTSTKVATQFEDNDLLTTTGKSFLQSGKNGYSLYVEPMDADKDPDKGNNKLTITNKTNRPVVVVLMIGTEEEGTLVVDRFKEILPGETIGTGTHQKIVPWTCCTGAGLACITRPQNTPKDMVYKSGSRQEKMLQDYFMRTAHEMRSPFFSFQDDKDDNTHFRISVYDHHYVKPCDDVTSLVKHCKSVQGGAHIDGDPSYLNLNRLLSKVISDLPMTGTKFCTFAAWLQGQITFYTVGSGQSIVQPYTQVRGRALYFTYQHVVEGGMDSGKESHYVKVYESLSRGEKDYVSHDDEGEWEEMGDKASHTMIKRNPFVHVESGRDVGHQFTVQDLLTMKDGKVDGREVTKLLDAMDLGGNRSDEAIMTFNAEVESGALSSLTEAQRTQVVDIINNRCSVTDVREWKDTIFSVAEKMREVRVALLGKVDAMKQIANTGRALAAFGRMEKEGLTPPDHLPTKISEAIQVLQCSRTLPHWRNMPPMELKNLSGGTQILAAACKEAKRQNSSERSHLIDPDLKRVFYYQDDHSKSTMSTFYCPGRGDCGDIASPCIVIAFPGSHFDMELNKISASSLLPSNLLQSFAQITTGVGDFATDLTVLKGTQSSSERMKAGVSNTTSIIGTFPQGINVYLTGHSLGGSVAMHVLQELGGGNDIKSATVFNPGVGLDTTYLEMVLTNACDEDSKCGLLPRKKTKNKFPWMCTKLITHKCHGDSPNPAKADPVSVLAGGLGKATYNYEGAGIPNSILCHTMQMFVTDDVQRVVPKGVFPRGRGLKNALE